jgi:hypothetical protein
LLALAQHTLAVQNDHALGFEKRAAVNQYDHHPIRYIPHKNNVNEQHLPSPFVIARRYDEAIPKPKLKA